MGKEYNFYVMDIETLSNCTVFCFEHYKKSEKRSFVIHDLENNFDVLVNFLEHNRDFQEWHISFNGLGFDAQITEWILQNKFHLKGYGGCDIARAIYQEAQDVIGRSQRKEFQRYPEWKLSIGQVDIFSLMHWSNPAKMTSLKWLQCNMDWHNVLEMPIHHTATITTRQEIDEIKSYCENDVSSTKHAMGLCREEINIRVQLSKEYGINLHNASEPRLAKELFLHFLSQRTGMDKRDMKSMRTTRNIIAVKELLVPYIKFQRQEFIMLFNNFQKLMINVSSGTLRGAFKYNIKYKGLKLSYGVGGLHGDSGPGIYESKNGFIIKTSDVKSYYPNLAIENEFAPAHLDKKIFCDQYKWFYTERTKYDKKNPINYVYKILLNSVFGLSIEQNSMLSDPQVGVSITINGQLMLTMLIEMLCERIPDAKPLVANTDGIEVMIPEQYENMYMEICKEWEAITKLELEHDTFKKLCTFDCNNFIGELANGTTKCKGRFEFEAHDKYKANVLHKSKSFLVVPKAIFHYFIHGTDPAEYLKQNKNIFDYCGFARAKGDWQFYQIGVVPDIPAEYKNYTLEEMRTFLEKNGWERSWSDDNWVKSDAANKEANTGTDTRSAFFYTIKKEMIIEKKPLQKTMRYFMSKKGSKIIKLNKKDNREIQVEAGKHLLKEFNKYEKDVPWESYDIDEAFYLKEIKKEIETLIPNKSQFKLELFPESNGDNV